MTDFVDAESRTLVIRDVDLTTIPISSNVDSLCRLVVKAVRHSEDKLVVSDETVENVKKSSGVSSVFAALNAAREFRKSDNPLKRDLFEARACYCEILASKLVLTWNQDRIELFSIVLVSKWRVDNDEGIFESALEVAVDAHAVNFLQNILVQMCVRLIWEGHIELQPDPPTPQKLLFPTGATDFFHRLKIPKYQYCIHLLMMIVFVILFALTLQDGIHDKDMSPMEAFMWVFVAGMAYNEIRQMSFSMRWYFLSLFNWFDSCALFLFIVAGGFRMMALASDRVDWISWSIDVLALSFIPLSLALLNGFSGFEFWGSSMIVLEAMLKQSALFVIMLTFVLAAFACTFSILARVGLSIMPDMVYFLMKAMLNEANYHTAEKLHPFGGVLLLCFMSFSTVLLMNLLISIFNDSYSRVSSHSGEEFTWQYTMRVLSQFQLPDEYPFLVPFNVFDAVIAPLRYILPRYISRWIEDQLWKIVYMPFHLILYFWERFFPRAIEDCTIYPEEDPYADLSMEPTDATPPPTNALNEIQNLMQALSEKIQAFEDSGNSTQALCSCSCRAPKK